MNRSFFARLWVRAINLVILLLTLYIIVFRIRPVAAETAPGQILLPFLLTYIVAAYLLAPLSVRIAGVLSLRKRVPRYTSSVDGLPTDPVNIVIVGSFAMLKDAYSASNWCIADKLNVKNVWRMAVSFVTDKPYPHAPFSRLYLFGRKQDIGFQKSIGTSARKRHHVRYWALEDAPNDIRSLSYKFWHRKTQADVTTANIWVGAVTKDIGLGLSRGTFQISHLVEHDTVAERDFMVSELKRTGLVERTSLVKPDEHFEFERINAFKHDGATAVIYLKEQRGTHKSTRRRALKSR